MKQQREKQGCLCADSKTGKNLSTGIIRTRQGATKTPCLNYCIGLYQRLIDFIVENRIAEQKNKSEPFTNHERVAIPICELPRLTDL